MPRRRLARQEDVLTGEADVGRQVGTGCATDSEKSGRKARLVNRFHDALLPLKVKKTDSACIEQEACQFAKTSYKQFVTSTSVVRVRYAGARKSVFALNW